MAAYSGIVRQGVVELGETFIPEGTRVRVLPEPEEEERTPEGWRRGSPEAILAGLETLPECRPDDVDALLEAIRGAKRPAQVNKHLSDAGALR